MNTITGHFNITILFVSCTNKYTSTVSLYLYFIKCIILNIFQTRYVRIIIFLTNITLFCSFQMFGNWIHLHPDVHINSVSDTIQKQLPGFSAISYLTNYQFYNEHRIFIMVTLKTSYKLKIKI